MIDLIKHITYPIRLWKCKRISMKAYKLRVHYITRVSKDIKEIQEGLEKLGPLAPEGYLMLVNKIDGKIQQALHRYEQYKNNLDIDDYTSALISVEYAEHDFSEAMCDFQKFRQKFQYYEEVVKSLQNTI